MSLPKTNKPILSPFLFSINSFAASLTASNLFGLKSSASILLLVSNTRTMSITSTVISLSTEEILGLAKPIMIETNAIIKRELIKNTLTLP